MKRKKTKKKYGPYGIQAIAMTKAAALECVARVLIDYEDTPRVTVAELANKIVKKLGFK